MRENNGQVNRGGDLRQGRRKYRDERGHTISRRSLLHSRDDAEGQRQRDHQREDPEGENARPLEPLDDEPGDRLVFLEGFAQIAVQHGADPIRVA
jgi:hypothetical protein